MNVALIKLIQIFYWNAKVFILCTKLLDCLITVHESCKDEVLNSCFFTESMKITKSVICVQGNDTNGQKTENISETSDLLSCLTLNDNNLDKMEEVMTEIIDSELKYTDDMNTTSKVE